MKIPSGPCVISRRSLLAALGIAGLALGDAVVRNPLLAQTSGGTDTGWTAVAQALGRTGSMQPGGVYKFGMPRTDLTVRIDGVTLRPALALGAWLAFKRQDATGRTIAMGDLVLLDTEAGPVMRKLQAEGIQQTALHNHVLGETPRIMYMHIMAEGDPVRIARGVRGALALTGTPAPAPPMAPSPTAFGLDTAALARVLGYGGRVNGGVYQVSVPRLDSVRVNGTVVPPAMGTATGINFQPVAGGHAAVTGDFVLTGDEVNPVISVLDGYDIAVTAVHSHMIGDEPRLFFLHFWAVDDAGHLAQGLRAALARAKMKAPAP